VNAEGATTPLLCEARSRRVVRTLVERIQREFAEPLELKQLARECGLNASYLSTVFAREAGLPFKTYLTALRLQHAQVLLGDPRLTIARVAKKVGYASPHRFRAAFRASTGLSPGRWRTGRVVKAGR
jgi:two-component system response regulator YesN